MYNLWSVISFMRAYQSNEEMEEEQDPVDLLQDYWLEGGSTTGGSVLDSLYLDPVVHHRLQRMLDGQPVLIALKEKANAREKFEKKG